MKKGRVLLLTVDFPPIGGGMSEHALGIAKGLDQLNYDVSVLAPRRSGDVPFDRKLQSIRVYRYPLPSSLVLRVLVLTFYAIQILVKQRIRLVICNTWSPGGVVAYLLAPLFRLRYVVCAHGLDVLEPQRSPSMKKWMVRVLRRAARIIPVSGFTGKAIAALGIQEEQITVIQNGIDPVRWPSPVDSSGLVLRSGLDGKRVVLTVSRLVRRKGHDLVLKAFKAISEEFPELVYLIVGDGPERSALESLVQEMGLEQRVSFAGYVKDEDLHLYYDLCDLFVLTPTEIAEEGDVEGFGIVYLEANVMGKAVIASRSGGIGDAVIDGETGLLVPAGDYRQIRDAMRSLLRDPEAARQLGQKGKERVLTHFTWNHVCLRLEETLSGLCS